MGIQTVEGKVTVWRQSLQGKELHKPFRLQLPHNARIIRAGIEPGPGTPAFWYLVDPSSSEDTEERYFMVAFTGAVLETPATHHGMWWEAAFVFHLFELFSDPSLLVNVFKDEE